MLRSAEYRATRNQAEEATEDPEKPEQTAKADKKEDAQHDQAGSHDDFLKSIFMPLIREDGDTGAKLPKPEKKMIDPAKKQRNKSSGPSSILREEEIDER